MTEDEVAAVCQAFQYKPGSHVEFWHELSTGFTIRTGIRVPDMQNPHRWTVLGRGYRMTPRMIREMTKRELVAVIAAEFDQLENHERDEWMTYQGARLKNPHPETPTSFMYGSSFDYQGKLLAFQKPKELTGLKVLVADEGEIATWRTALPVDPIPFAPKPPVLPLQEALEIVPMAEWRARASDSDTQG